MLSWVYIYGDTIVIGVYVNVGVFVLMDRINFVSEAPYDLQLKVLQDLSFPLASEE